ncbi:MAG: hypothetical protein A3E83_09060 [Gammaproteobacteria bacterium RIFCSPHIGHO2_12_FULL_41_20]|nr:MAG: hypothetical protein A3E83_09060 [Gammaproteobacteria bacterium RIFCSPHIGHO2_12_FULL_41_20]
MRLSMATFLGLGLCCASVYAQDNQSMLSTTTMSEPVMSSTTAEKNQTMGAAFLAANKNKPGVVTLPDGLQYKVMVAGTGAQPTDSDVVTVHYAGKLVNGTEFDSSYKRGQPTTFPVAGVIPGWTEALKLMKVGSTWELYIPASLAYGERGALPVIGPNETLIFKVELLSVQKA